MVFDEYIWRNNKIRKCRFMHTHAHKTCAPDRPADRLTPTLWLTLRTRPAHRLALASANLPLAPRVSPCCHPCDSASSFPSASHFPHLMLLFFLVSVVRLTNSITEIWERAAEVRQCKKEAPEDDHMGFKQTRVGSDKLWRENEEAAVKVSPDPSDVNTHHGSSFVKPDDAVFSLCDCLSIT